MLLRSLLVPEFLLEISDNSVRVFKFSLTFQNLFILKTASQGGNN